MFKPRGRGRPPHADILTPAEWRVAEAVRHGLSNPEIAAGQGTSFAVKYDGTLWGWGANYSGQSGIGDAKTITNAVQIGASTNWAKIWAGNIQTIGLQTDGSLWFWPLERSDYYRDYDDGNGSHFEPLLDISHKPQWLGNVFGKAD